MDRTMTRPTLLNAMNLPTLRKLAAPAAVLLALFAAACQPGTATDAPAVRTASGPPPALESFRSGEFEQLDFSQDLAIPASSFVDGDGAEQTFAKYAGKVVVFNIWAEWCAPCVEEMPSLARLQEHFAGTDVVVVPIAFGYPDSRDSARAKLIQLVGDKLPFYYDSAYNVSADAKSGAFPSTIIYDREGREQARLMRPADWGSEHAIALVQAVADGAT